MTPTSTDQVIDRWLQGILDEVERVYPDRVAALPEDRWWHPIGPGQPCECCGTLIFPLEDHHGARRWCQVGELPPGGTPICLPFHTPDQCRRTPVDLAELLKEPTQ